MDTNDVAAQLRERCLGLLRVAGHLPCDWSGTARYEPDAGAVVCGCGEFVEWPDGDPINGGAAASAASAALERQPSDPISSTLALIDPNEQYTPVDVERHILDVLSRLETGALFERETVLAEYEAKTKFERAYWAALNTSQEGAADRRKADAMTQCADLHEDLIRAEMLAKAVKATMHNLRAVLSGYQSTSRSVGAAYQAGGSTGRTY